MVIVQRRIPDDDSGNSTTVTYYDWVRQANLIVITPDANESDVLWDLELGTHHSYYFTPARQVCQPFQFPVGILEPTWLANATCLGESTVMGRQTVGWTKVDFIDYYADAETGEPVRWYFHGMKARFDTIYYAPGQQVPAASYFEPPAYCGNTTTTRRWR
jgi:hypothetical protein